MKPSESRFMKIGGLKCDREGCDYMDSNINADDYDKYIDAKCPKCESSLLTQKDFNTIQRMLKIESIVLKCLRALGIKSIDKQFTDENPVELSMNGSGNIFLKNKKEI